MAVDTRQKRQDAVNTALPIAMLLPPPAGAIATADRQSLAWTYSGLTVGALVLHVYEAIVNIRAVAAAITAVRALAAMSTNVRVTATDEVEL